MVNGIADGVANFLPIILIKFLTIKQLYIFSYATACIAYAIVMYSESSSNSSLMPLGVLGGKGGGAIAFCSLYFTLLSYFTP